MEQIVSSYYLVKYEVLNLTEDFAKIIARLSDYRDLTVTSVDPGRISITYPNAKAPIQLSVSTFANDFSGNSAALLLTCDKTDGSIIHLFRAIAGEFGYRIYHTGLNCFLPSDDDLVDAGNLVPTEKAVKVFRVKQMEPVFINKETSVYYCRSYIDGSIRIINPGMFSYFVNYDVTEEDAPEFSYKVADSLVQFVAYYDAGLIPGSFYRYWDRDQKIINYSFLDIRIPDRKIFIKPYFYVYNTERQAYTELVSDKSALSFADKIRNGETLDMSINRIVRDELKIASGYERAKVASFVGFDRDKENILTPMTHVSIYLGETTLPEEVKVQSQRGWTSLNKQVN